MKRILAIGIGLLWSGAAMAAVSNVYWTDRNNGTVSVTNVSSGETTQLVQGFTRLQDVDLDSSVGTLYFAEWGTPGPPGGEGSINLVNIDGTGLAEILSTGDAVHQLALDEASQQIYYTRAVSYDNREIGRVDMSGANNTVLFTGDGWFYSGLAIDTANNAVYWGDIGVIGGTVNGAVNTMTLTGGTPTLLAPHVDGRGRGMAIDLASQTIFLTAHDALTPSSGGGLFSYDIGSGVLTQLIDDPTTGYWDIEIDTESQRIWWADYGRGEVRSAAYDGTDVQVELSGLTNVYGIALDTGGIDSTVARFPVTKTYTDGASFPVEVTLSCNGGLPLQQSFTLAGDGDSVTFVLTNIPDVGVDCEITETDGPDGYTAVMNGGNGCSWNDLTGGSYACAIENQPNPAEYSVTTNWVVPDAGLEEETYDVDVTITCDTEILTLNGGTPPGAPTNQIMVIMDEGDTFTITVDTGDGDTECTADQFLTQSGVETLATESCSGANLSAGDSASCVFTNTVFFEGIPTLSQYGMAIMALLMLGVGFVGMRRFV